MTTFFTEEMAASYDQRFARLAPLREALNLALRVVLRDLPAEARILCVGAGTGAEVLALGEANPGWRFTLVEPAPAMLAQARRRCGQAQLASRCDFHAGVLETLPQQEPYDAATSILVSQFVVDSEERRKFYAGIAARLAPGARFVSADLSADSDSLAQIVEIWLELLRYNGFTNEDVAGWMEARGRDFRVSTTREMANLIEASGFEPPVRFLQAVLIQAFSTRRKV